MGQWSLNTLQVGDQKTNPTKAGHLDLSNQDHAALTWQEDEEEEEEEEEYPPFLFAGVWGLTRGGTGSRLGGRGPAPYRSSDSRNSCKLGTRCMSFPLCAGPSTQRS